MALSPQDGVAEAGGSGATIQEGGKKKKNKNRGRGGPQAGAPVAAAAAPPAAGGQNANDKRPCPQGGNGGSCPVHPTARHSAADCHEIQKLAKRVSGRREQASKDGSPPFRQQSGKEKPQTARLLSGRRSWGTNPPLGS